VKAEEVERLREAYRRLEEVAEGGEEGAEQGVGAVLAERLL
jgi:vacuolar-type H+-ATPase catalytic subunit A/Vma1